MIGRVSNMSQWLSYLLLRLHTRTAVQQVEEALTNDFQVTFDRSLIIQYKTSLLYLLTEHDKMLVIILATQTSEQLRNSRIVCNFSIDLHCFVCVCVHLFYFFFFRDIASLTIYSFVVVTSALAVVLILQRFLKLASRCTMVAGLWISISVDWRFLVRFRPRATSAMFPRITGTSSSHSKFISPRSATIPLFIKKHLSDDSLFIHNF